MSCMRRHVYALSLTTSGVLWSTNYGDLMAKSCPPKSTNSKDHTSAIRGCCAPIFHVQYTLFFWPRRSTSAYKVTNEWWIMEHASWTQQNANSADHQRKAEMQRRQTALIEWRERCTSVPAGRHMTRNLNRIRVNMHAGNGNSDDHFASVSEWNHQKYTLCK